MSVGPGLHVVSRRRLAVLTLSVLLLLPAPGLASELVAHWAFDQLTGRTVTDSSGHGNTGSFTPNSSSAPRWTTGGIGLAMDFDAVADTITVPDSPSLRLPTFTVALWLLVDRPAIVGLDLARYHQATILRRGWVLGAVGQVSVPPGH